MARRPRVLSEDEYLNSKGVGSVLSGFMQDTCRTKRQGIDKLKLHEVKSENQESYLVIRIDTTQKEIRLEKNTHV